MSKDYYDILNVSKSASDAEIKSAYRKLAMKYHPDRNPDDKSAETKFKEVSEAYDVLKDSQKRSTYDQFGHSAFTNSNGGQSQGFGGFSGGFSDIFEQMFSEFTGGQNEGRQGRKGADLRYDLSVSLEDAYSGCNQDIQITVSESVRTVQEQERLKEVSQ